MMTVMERKILIVDDEPSILALLEELFTKTGYRVVTASSAEEALGILQKESILVMFLDMALPGMSGVDLCRQIRKNDQIGILYAFTGYSNFFGLLECRAAGFDDFFTKPAEIQLLLKAAEDAFEKLDRWGAAEMHQG